MVAHVSVKCIAVNTRFSLLTVMEAGNDFQYEIFSRSYLKRG
jgi:hypothetical protein